jgi:nitrogen regulatory protein PII
MKRLDLIMSELELEKVLQAIRAAGAPGYSVTRHVTGRGSSGDVVSESMEFSGLGANAHVIVFCDAATIEKLRPAIRSILDYYGGVAFVADAEPL